MQSSSIRSMRLVLLMEKKRSLMNVIMNSWELQQQRFMVGKATDRSGVHGSHLPTVDTLDEEVEKEINKGKEDKESKRKHVEKVVDSHLKRSNQNPKSPPNQH